MDPITHALVAYSLVFWFDKIKKVPTKFVVPIIIGSILPDIDVVFNFIVYFFPKVFWLEHRAITHSLLGIIPFVFITAAILNIPKLKDKIWKHEKFSDLNFWSVGGILSLYIGTLLHFSVDIIVPTGMMIFFPISFKWYGIKLLSSNNIHTIAALMFVTTVWPLKWDKRRKTMSLAFFMIVFSFFGTIRIITSMRATNLFNEKYGTGAYSSNEIIFTHNINYKIIDGPKADNRTLILATIDGMKKIFLEEQVIPELLIISSQADKEMGYNLLNITKQDGHYLRLRQKYPFVSGVAYQENPLELDSLWIIIWTSPIRAAQKSFQFGLFEYTTTTEIKYFIQENGEIMKIERPVGI
ncbi:MAG: metal-dependent hydrolase [Candidatus Heimdallarchaeota archaeon]